MDDAKLILGLVSRDKSVFDYIFNYYYSSLCAFSMRYIDDSAEVEDLVQDFFVSLWLLAPKLNIKVSLKSYLFTSVRNRCIDFLKHQKIDQKYKTYLLTADINEETTELHYAESELRQAIDACMSKLTPRCREIFIMSREKGMSNDEIAKDLDISKRTVELQISKSLKILRSELVEYFPSILIYFLLR